MKNKGITLIALIITIIVLLILAGVSIALVMGDNGILNKANVAKKNTVIGDVKDTSEIIRGEYEVDNEGKSPSSRYIIEKLIEQGKIDSSQVEDYGDDTGIGIIIVENERVEINGQKMPSVISTAFHDNVMYVLFDNGNLCTIPCVKNTSGSELLSVSLSNAETFFSNVKDFNHNAFLTDDNKLYMYDYSNKEFLLKADNVKKVYQYGYAYISNDNVAYSFLGDTYDIKNGQFVQLGSNAKEIIGEDAYTTLDGKSVIKLTIDESSITIDEELIKVSYDYYLTQNGELYKEDMTTRGKFDKVAENVKEFERGNIYFTNDGILFDMRNNVEVSRNVKKFYSSNLYITNDDELYENGFKIADNVKDVGYYFYITNANIIHELNDMLNSELSETDVIAYDLDTSEWFVTTSNTLYYAYTVMD